MQHVLNNRDTEVLQRKARVHRRLARHVTRSCQMRRRLCKAEAVGREETYKVRMGGCLCVCVGVSLCGCMGGLHLYM